MEQVHSCWSTSRGKRALDLALASAGLLVSLPVMAVTAAAVKLSSRGPILFRQTRMGWHGEPFTIYKFRTMQCDAAEVGPSVTKTGDSRLTPSGGLMRRWKLDELPQLFNVVCGHMSLVGPRPKLPHHQTHVLRVRPGITGAASLAFRNEEAVLHGVADEHLDLYQIRVLMPVKKKLDDDYAESATLRSDLRLLCKTVLGRGEPLEDEATRLFQSSLMALNGVLHGRHYQTHSPIHQRESELTQVA